MNKILLTFAILCSFSFNNFAQSITHYVNSGNFYYTPSSLTINEGDTVVWLNDGGFHNVNADINTLTGSSFNNPVAFSSSPTSNATLYTFIFTVPGTYNYDCSVGSHAANGMVSSLIVNSLPIPGCTDILASNYDSLATIDDGSCLYSATFNVDMNCEPIGSFGYVHLESPLFGWCGGCVPMTDTDGDGVWTVTVDLAAGNFEYKYAVDGFAGQEDLVDDMLAGETCAPVTDYFSYANRLESIVAGFMITDTYGSCSSCLLGCTDPLALNYDVNATTDDGSCTYPSNSIYDIVANSSDHTILEIAIDTCSLAGVLSGPGTFTLFAPTDAAFNLLPSGTIPALLSDLPQLSGILTHHVLGDTVMSNTLFNGQIAQTLLGSNLTVTIDTATGSVYIDNALVTVADIISDNGVIHVIDAVLLPPLGCTDSLASNFDPLALVDNGSCTFTITDCNGISNGTSLLDSCGVCQQAYIYNFATNIPTFLNDTSGIVLGPTEMLVMPNDPANPLWNSSCSGCTDPLALNYDSTATYDNGTCTYSNSVYDIVSNSTDHTILKIAIDTCGLDGTLSAAGPFTLFAPTDAVFNALPSGTIGALLSDLPTLTNILLHHVVADSVMSGMLSNGQVVTTLLGTNVTVTINSSGVYIDNAMVTIADIIADNGVVHVIDAVLVPSGCTDFSALNFDINAIIDDDSCVYANSIYDIVTASADHNILKTAIDTCGLSGYLQGPGPFTLFAPTDAAFSALPPGTITALLNDLPLLTDILKHHVLADSVRSGMLSNGQVVTTLLGTNVTVTIINGMVYIDNALVTLFDRVADNGVVHVINAVLLPPTPPVSNSIYDIVSNSADHITLKTAIDACGLDGTLSAAGPYTLFAPTDAAFNALPSGTVAALLNDLPQLTDILKHHAVGDSVMSGMLSNGQVVTTLLGTNVTVTINSSGVYIDNAMVTVADIIADNGVVHVINAVLLPSTTGIDNIDNEVISTYLYSVNILGERVKRDKKNQIILDIYSNGKIVKTFKR